MRKQMTLIVLTLMLVATAGVVAYDSVDPVITFPDSNLELAVRWAIYEQLRKETNDIHQSDLKQLTSLSPGFMRRKIRNLYGLENCINLEGLWLGNNDIDDIFPLSGLTELTTLILDGNEITDISPLARLTSLERLAINANRISDLEPLANLTSLTVLSATQNNVGDISPLAGLSGLTELSLGDNRIADISPLADLTNLTSLRLSDNQITDISPLVENIGLAEGDEVYIRNNPLSAKSINEYIPQLKAMGIKVFWQEKNEE